MRSTTNRVVKSGVQMNSIATVQEQFNETFVRPLKNEKEAQDFLVGQRLCEEGVPEDSRWNEFVRRGYGAQYQLEQLESARSR